MNRLKNRLLLIVTSIVLLIFFTNDFGLIDVEKTAIIVAIGIDKSSDDNYEVTAQIAVPQSTNDEPSNADSVVSAKGKTIAYAIDEIGVKTGWYPKLSFCNIIILGESLKKTNIFDILEYFIRTEKIQDSALVAFSDLSAKEMLNIATPLDALSSFALQKILIKDVTKVDNIAVINLKEVFKNHYSRANYCYMPMIKAINLQENTNGESSGAGGSDESSSSSGSGSSGGSGGGSSPTNQKGNYIFDATSTMFFYDGEFVADFTGEQTLFFNLLYKKAYATYFPIEDVEVDGKTANILLNINDTDYSFKLKFKDNKPIFQINLTVKVKFKDLNINRDLEKTNQKEQVPANVLEKTKVKIEGIYDDIFSKMVSTNCDFFGLTNNLYKFNHKYYNEYKNNLIRSLSLEKNIKCQIGYS